MDSENVMIDQEVVERALTSIAKIAETVSRMEWNYDRLVSKRSKLLAQAIVAYWKSISLKDDFLYDIRLNYSTYEYDCGMLNENLTRELLKLDGINSNGNEEIRLKRKEQVKRILELQDRITVLHRRAVSLSVYYRSLLASPRYQALLASESSESSESSEKEDDLSNLPELENPEYDLPTETEVEKAKGRQSPVAPSIKKQASLKRQKSVHRIPVLSPAEFEEHILQQLKQQQKDEMNDMMNTEGGMMSVMEEEKKEREKEKEKEDPFLPDEDAALLMEEILNENNNDDNNGSTNDNNNSSMEEEEEKEEEEEEEEEEEDDDNSDTDLLNEYDDKPSSRPMNAVNDHRNQQYRQQQQYQEEEERENGMMEEENSEDNENAAVKSDFEPRYQWLRRGKELCLVLLDVEVDQKSLKIVTRPPTQKQHHHSHLSSSLSSSEGQVIIRGYRIQKTTRPRGYYSLFYNPQPTYVYVPFTSVITIPDLPVDYSKSPRAMYYSDQNVLEVTYAIKQVKPRQPFVAPTARRSTSTSPRHFSRDPRFDEYDSDGESGYYQSPYYRNPYNSYRQQYRPQREVFYPFFGNGLW